MPKDMPDGGYDRPGAPTKYEPSMCEQVIAWGRDGKSRTWIAAALGIHKDTLYEWISTHPEFSDALKRAKALEQQWWEDKGQQCLVMRGGETFSQSAWSKSMSVRFPDEWREKIAHVGGDKDDQPIQAEVTVNADAFTRRIAGLAPRVRAGDADGGSE